MVELHTKHPQIFIKFLFFIYEKLKFTYYPGMGKTLRGEKLTLLLMLMNDIICLKY